MTTLAADVVAAFLKRLASDEALRDELDVLRGKRLSCWSYAFAPHAVIVAYANLPDAEKKLLVDLTRRESDVHPAEMRAVRMLCAHVEEYFRRE